uniref:Putative secreted protein n=1 Tax=Anopheles marajoara TaxID=58244 RepID=A0A2M4CFP5_9DIPT
MRVIGPRPSYTLAAAFVLLHNSVPVPEVNYELDAAFLVRCLCWMFPTTTKLTAAVDHRRSSLELCR